MTHDSRENESLEIINKKVVIGPDRLTRFERARIVGAFCYLLKILTINLL
ncbi:MAG: hypothetical protein ACTSQC_05055 [Candidatus Heimdallarchaeaceae archaeon]